MAELGGCPRPGCLGHRTLLWTPWHTYFDDPAREVGTEVDLKGDRRGGFVCFSRVLDPRVPPRRARAVVTFKPGKIKKEIDVLTTDFFNGLPKNIPRFLPPLESPHNTPHTTHHTPQTGGLVSRTRNQSRLCSGHRLCPHTRPMAAAAESDNNMGDFGEDFAGYVASISPRLLRPQCAPLTQIPHHEQI